MAAGTASSAASRLAAASAPRSIRRTCWQPRHA